jgi:heterodisulfide reductase subunit C
MPIVERSLVEVERTEQLELDGVDVSGDWNAFLKPRVLTDLDSRIVDWVKTQPFGDTISQCWQCGTCTASCCMHTDYGMPEFNPRQFIYLAQIGDEKELRRHSDAIWRCISCNKCVERCPKGVKVEEVVHAIGRYLRATGAAAESPADRFDRVYAQNLLERGVLDEAALFRTYERGEGRKTPLRDLLRTGWRLLRTGRLRTGPFANRTRGWRKMGPVLRAKLKEDEAASSRLGTPPRATSGGVR